MSDSIDKIIFSEDEIIEIAERIYDDYSILFEQKKNSKRTIKSLAKQLSTYGISENEKLMILECAARIKFELKLVIDSNYSLSLNRYYFRFKKNDFIIKMSVGMFSNRGLDFLYYFPTVVQTSLNSAFCKTKMKNNSVKKLTKQNGS